MKLQCEQSLCPIRQQNGKVEWRLKWKDSWAYELLCWFESSVLG